MVYPEGSEEGFSWQGDWSFGLYTGAYNITDPAGQTVAQATIERGEVSQVELPTGTLSVSDPGAAGYIVYPEGSEEGFSWQGDWSFGLYAGGYEIRSVGGEPLGHVTVHTGEVANFNVGD
jgi:hypothetical protein